MSPLFKPSITVLILATAVLIFTACATNYVGPVSKMPPCKGVWVSMDGGRTYECYSQRRFQEWRKLNGL